MRALASLVALFTLTGCASYLAEAYDLTMNRPGAELAFMRGEAGWRLSTVPPLFPYNSEVAPRFDGMSGAGSDTPFGCGLGAVKAGYFSGARGRLVCAVGQTEGVVHLQPVGRGVYRRVYDATRMSGRLTVIAHPYGGQQAVVMTVIPGGEPSVTGRLPENLNPDQAAVLPSGRIAALHRDNGACVWSVFAFEDGVAREISRVSADHPFQCSSSSSGLRLLRDQATGEAYLRMRHPVSRMLYRIGDNGTQSPATLVTEDFAVGATSDPDLETVLNGALYFRLHTASGQLAGRYHMASNRTGTVDLTSPTGRWQDAAQLTGFMVGEAASDPPRMTLMDARSGETTLVAMRIPG